MSPNAARPAMLVIPTGQHPAAEGTLGQTPLLHLYVYLLDKSLTGTMVLTQPSGTALGFYVQDGCPIRAQTREGKLAEDRFALEKALVDLCALPVETRYAFFAREDLFGGETPTLNRAEPLAKIMSAARACVDNPFAASTLRKVMKAPAIKLAVGAAPERFRLSPEERALVERLRKQAMTFADLVSTSGVPEQIVRGVIYGLTITRHLDFGIPARPPVGVGVHPAATAHGSSASGQSVQPTQAAATAPAMTWNPLKAGTTAAVPVEQTGPRVRTDSIPEVHEAPPSSKMPLSYRMIDSVSGEKRRAEIEAKIASAESENHFELLGILENASLLEIRDAYFGMARIFHPDRLVDFPDLRPRAQAHFARINAAYNELSDDRKRAAYVAKLKAAAPAPDGKPTLPHVQDAREQEAVENAINAAFEAQKAEIFLKKHELALAETHAARAVKADPEQPSYAALLVWIIAQRRPAPHVEEGHTSDVYDDLISRLDQLLKKEPNFERAVFYRAVLLQRSGHHERALKDYTRALELNPRNIEAAREVRLAKLRGKVEEPAPASASPKSGGLFGKLFKR